MKSIKNITLNLLCLCISLGVILLLAEIVLAFYFPDASVTVDILGRRIAARTTPHFVPVTHGEESFWMLAPDQSGREKLLNDFDYTWSINSLGVRDDEVFKKQDGVIRILVLGDSQTFGIGVEDTETFCSLLEKKLNDAGRFQVINAGTHGYGTAEELLRLQQLAPVVHPDIVITALHADNLLICDQGNDLWNNYDWLQRKASAAGPDPGPAVQPPVNKNLYAQVKDFLRTRSHFVRFLYRHYLRLRGERHIDQAKKFFDLPPQERKTQDIWNATRELLIRIDDYCRLQCKARHTIVYIPGPLSLMFSDQSAEQEITPLGFDYVSVYPFFKQAQENTGRQLTFIHDSHYNAFAHSIIADVLFEHIRGTVLLANNQSMP